MKRYKLTVEKRKILGKKVRKLRKEGLLPANIYGKGVKSLAVQVPYKEFEKIYKEAGETGIVDVDIAGEVRPSLIHNVHQDYKKHLLLHADFFQVNLKEKINAMIKVLTVGEAKAVVEKVGILIQTLEEIEVEALPTDLPEKIEVNVEALAAINDQITVADIKAPTGVTILTDPGQVIAKIDTLVSKEAAEQAAAEEAAAESAKTEGAEEEGKTPDAGEKTTEEKTKPEEKTEDPSKPTAGPQK